jgi:branched-chain amino acid transport system substrate-binding protein
MKRLEKGRRFTLASAGLCVALLLTGCASRVSHEAIVAAARGVELGTSQSAQAAGSGSVGAQVGTNAAGSSSAAPGVGTGATSAGASGDAAASSPDATASAANPGATVTKTTTAAAATESTVYLGNVGTYSGLIGAIFTGGQQTLQIWAAYTNAHGGLNGHPVKVISEDDGGDPSTNQTDTEQEVTQDHVIAFVGDLVPLTVSASLSYLQQQNIPVIGGDASSLTWWQSPMLFPQASYLRYEGDDTIRWAVSLGKTKLAMLYCIEDTTCTEGYDEEIEQGGAQADGADPVYSASYSLTQPDFTSQCLAAQQAGANVFYMAGDGDSLVRLARDCSAQNYDPLYIAESVAVTASVQADPELNGLLSTQSNFPWVDSYTPAQATYQAAMKQYDPSLPGSATTAAEWASGMLVVAADGDLGATPTSAQFLQGLWSIKNNNLGGLAPPLTFNANADATPSNCYFDMILQNGQFTDPHQGNSHCIS